MPTQHWTPEMLQYMIWKPHLAYGKCAEATLAMEERFPELTRTRGYYLDLFWGPREHWWLVDQQGRIVDPTCLQFPTRGTGEYQPWDEAQPEPTGRCPNCGDLCYNNQTCCSENCHIEYAAFCRQGSW